MKLTDYIFGSRRGREANRLEREAMADPFLADAVEGYDSVYGGHSDKLAELEQEVARRAVRPRRRAGRRRIVPLIRGCCGRRRGGSMVSPAAVVRGSFGGDCPSRPLFRTSGGEPYGTRGGLCGACGRFCGTVGGILGGTGRRAGRAGGGLCGSG